MATHDPLPDDRTFTPPRAIARVLRVMEVLATQARRMSLAELSSTLGVPKTSLFAILKGLEQAGYVAFENETYGLCSQALKLARAITGARAFPDCTRPILEQLAQTSGETVILATLSEDRRHVIYEIVVETDSWLRFSVRAGTRRPLSAAASGHAVLSFLPEVERNRYLHSGPFERFTPRTVATSTALGKVIAKVRRDACSMTTEGTVTAATGIAAPFFDGDGAVKGSVLVAAPTSRVADREQQIKTETKLAAEDISRQLAYSGVYPLLPSA